MTRAGKSGYGRMNCPGQNFRSIDIPFAMYFAVHLIKECFWNIATPNVQHLIFCWSSSNRIFIINKVAVSIMFDHESVYIIPVIKNLTTKNVTANTPTQFITLLLKPLMSKKLCVEVMNLKGAVMDMDGRLFLAKEGVMINVILTAIEVEKTGDILAIGREQDIRWL